MRFHGEHKKTMTSRLIGLESWSELGRRASTCPNGYAHTRSYSQLSFATALSRSFCEGLV